MSKKVVPLSLIKKSSVLTYSFLFVFSILSLFII